MKLEEHFELLESLFVELDPLEDAFTGVLLEIHRRGNRYVLLEVAPSTGNQLLRFSSQDRALVYAAFARELGGSLKRIVCCGFFLPQPLPLVWRNALCSWDTA